MYRGMIGVEPTCLALGLNASLQVLIAGRKSQSLWYGGRLDIGRS